MLPERKMWHLNPIIVCTALAVLSRSTLSQTFGAKPLTPAPVAALYNDPQLGVYMTNLFNAQCYYSSASRYWYPIPVQLQPGDTGYVKILVMQFCGAPDYGFLHWVEMMNNRTQGLVIGGLRYRLHVDYILGTNTNLLNNATIVNPPLDVTGIQNAACVLLNATGQYYDYMHTYQGSLSACKEFAERFIKKPICLSAGAASTLFWALTPVNQQYVLIQTPTATGSANLNAVTNVTTLMTLLNQTYNNNPPALLTAYLKFWLPPATPGWPYPNLYVNFLLQPNYPTGSLPYYGFGSMVSLTTYTTDFITLMKSRGLKTVYVIQDTLSAYSWLYAPIAQGAVTNVGKLNMTLVASKTVAWNQGNYVPVVVAKDFIAETSNASFCQGANNFEPEISRAIGNQSDVLILVGFDPLLLCAFETLKARKYNFRAVFATVGLMPYLWNAYLSMSDNFGEALNYVYYPTQWNENQFYLDDTGTFPTEGSLGYVKSYFNRVGILPDYIAAASFACGIVFQQALTTQSGTLWNATDAASIATRTANLQRALADTSIDNSIFGSIMFNRYNQNIGKTAVLVQIQNVIKPAAPGSSEDTSIPCYNRVNPFFSFSVGFCHKALTPLSAKVGDPILNPTWESRIGCPPGKFNDGTQCTDCPANTYRDISSTPNNMTSCFPCDIGTGSIAGQSSCSPCMPGTYAPTVGSGCLPCPIGKATNITGQASCSDCLAGQYADVVGLTTCKACDPGSANSKSGQGSCAQCLAGFYSASSGTITCSRCEPGTYQNQTGQASCTSCPDTYVTNYFSAISISDCTCAQNFYYNAVSDKCQPCQTGSICPGGKGIPLVANGYWAHAVTDASKFSGLSVYKCMVAAACTWPQGVAPGYCRLQREGIGCSTCQRGYYESDRLRAKCSLCGDSETRGDQIAAQASSCSHYSSASSLGPT